MLKLKVAAVVIISVIAFFAVGRPLTAGAVEGQLAADSENNSVFLAAAGAPQTTHAIKCDVEAYRRGMHDDVNPAVTNIRSQPNKNSSIVKVIKTTDEVVFFITGNSNGWFEVSKVESIGTDDDKALFAGRGWVHSSQLDLSVAGGDQRLYSQPKKTSRVLRKLIVDESPSEPLACQGKWMKVKSGNLTGWLSPEGQCANPLTTCP